MATSTGEGTRDWGPALQAIPLGHTESVRKTVEETDIYLFAGITGDFSGVHVDEEFSKGTRFGRRIAHGALLVGFVSTVMARMTALLPPAGGVSSRYEGCVEATGAAAVVPANPGRILQMAAGLRVRERAVEVLHVVEVLDRAYAAAERAQP